MAPALQGYNYHIVGGDPDIDKIMEVEGAYSAGLKHADFVIFSGGVDVSPSMYNEFVIRPEVEEPDRDRDRYEARVFQHATKAKLLIGICRGAQLLCVLNGGKLWQHVTGHRGSHPCLYTDEAGKKRFVNVTSDHHQMMIPTKHGEVWGVAGKSTHRWNGFTVNERAARMTDKHMLDPEIVFFRTARNQGSLCFQPHPEWTGTACRKLFFQCIQRALKEVK